MAGSHVRVCGNGLASRLLERQQTVVTRAAFLAKLDLSVISSLLVTPASEVFEMIFGWDMAEPRRTVACCCRCTHLMSSYPVFCISNLTTAGDLCPAKLGCPHWVFINTRTVLVYSRVVELKGFLRTPPSLKKLQNPTHRRLAYSCRQSIHMNAVNVTLIPPASWP